MAALCCLSAGCGAGGSALPPASEKPGPPRTGPPFTLSVPPPTPEGPPTDTPPTPTGSPNPTETPPDPGPDCPSRPLLGVYAPGRVRVLGTCRWFHGTVTGIVRLDDDDVRFLLLPARGSERYLNDVNRSALHGRFPAVIIYGQAMQLFRPDIGERIAVFGTWVRNVATGWNEMHPVWEVRYPGVTIYNTPPEPPLHGSR